MSISKSILKITSLLLMIGLNHSGLFAVGETAACFNDKEISEGNVYTAGTLDFSLFSPHDNFVSKIKVENMEPGDRVMRMIQVHQEGNLPFEYTIRTEKIGGDDNFCNALKLEARLEGEIKYPTTSSGDGLMDFNFSPVEMMDPPGIDTWQFKILLPDNASDNLQNKTCKFKFVFEGWQDNTENYKDNGFDDVEKIESEFSSSEWQSSNSNWVKVDYPNGGEIWYIGRHYKILWSAGNFDSCDGKLDIDIWYSVDSGETWANVVKKAKNKGFYNWRVPLFLYDEEGEIYLTASAKARIKVVATCLNNSAITAWDMSDEDFCPPIDYDLLTPEEIEVLKSLELFDPVKDNNIPDDASDTGEFEFEDEIDREEDILEENIEKKNSVDNNSDVIDVSGDSGENIEESENGELDKSEIDDINDDNNKGKNNDDAKDEKFVLTPKEEILPDGNDDNNNDSDGDEDFGEEEIIEDSGELSLDVKEKIEEINNDNTSDPGSKNIESSLNKNSVDCVQAIE